MSVQPSHSSYARVLQGLGQGPRDVTQSGLGGPLTRSTLARTLNAGAACEEHVGQRRLEKGEAPERSMPAAF